MKRTQRFILVLERSSKAKNSPLTQLYVVHIPQEQPKQTQVFIGLRTATLFFLLFQSL